MDNEHGERLAKIEGRVDNLFREVVRMHDEMVAMQAKPSKPYWYELAVVGMYALAIVFVVGSLTYIQGQKEAGNTIATEAIKSAIKVERQEKAIRKELAQ
jgi:hypothetical protein